MKTISNTIFASRLRQIYASLLVAVSLSFTPQSARAADQVPFRAAFDTVFESAVSFPLVSVQVVGEGYARHLGRTTIETTDEIINLLTTEGTATFQITAANGDEIWLEAVFVAPPTATGSLLIGGWEVTGGTGRFVNATGAGTFDGWAVFTGPTFGVGHFTMIGTISSPGSLR